ncbi:Aste57867_11649 [Aphanomyces stellatus]|uniref:Aste57867_11649 protein n=1 Tax=Aphanomyces stellatus TaxID=120398 RepID=A0A485KVG1_9STRA|nr:hypothetical protein As57867_011606 [Aphanomyces stellatus]VFT88507.1 Aste57867_11649 [Aphanomyces stellatus]
MEATTVSAPPFPTTAAAHDACTCPRVAQLEDEVASLQSQLFRYRRKYGNLDVIEQRRLSFQQSTSSEKADPIPQLSFDDDSPATLVSSTIGKHVVLDYVADSPMFRKSLDGLEESTSGLRGFLKELMTRTKEFVAAGKQMGAKETALAEIYSAKYSRTLFTSCFAELGELSTLLNDFHDTLAQIQSSRESMLLSIEALLFKPLEAFVEDELKAAGDLRRDVSKFGDEYDAILGKSLGKTNGGASSNLFQRSPSLSDTSSAAPDAAADASDRPLSTDSVDKTTTAARCKFELARFDCVRYFNALDAKKKFVLVEAFNSTLYSYLGHYHAGHDLVQAIEPVLRTRQAALQAARDQFARDDAMYAAQRDLLESRLSAYPTHVALPVEVISTQTASSRLDNNASGAEKQGYLIVRNSLFPSKSWKRVWFQIHLGKLYAIRKEMELTLVCDLLVSKVRPCASTALPFTFEVIDSTQTKHVLQATSDADMQSWIDAAQESTERLLGQQSHGAVVHPGHADAVLRLVAANPACADCGNAPADWISINVGVFLCIECSGIHRSLGVHVSKVRSLVLDKWDMTLVELLETQLGNAVANGIWEAAIAPGWTKPTAASPRADKERWIKAKYEFRGFSEHTPLKEDAIFADFLAAATAGRVAALVWAVAHGVDVARADAATKQTALHLAAAGGHTLACEYLVQNGAPLSCADAAGLLPSDAAKASGYEALKLLLLQRLG